jgi:hypothetical protein
MSNPVLTRGFGGDQPAAATAGADAALSAHDLRTTGSPVVAETMSVGGVSRATGIMLVVLLAGAFVGWNQVTATDPPQLPGFLWIPMLVGFGLAIAGVVKPGLAWLFGPCTPPRRDSCWGRSPGCTSSPGTGSSSRRSSPPSPPPS